MQKRYDNSPRIPDQIPVGMGICFNTRFDRPENDLIIMGQTLLIYKANTASDAGCTRTAAGASATDTNVSQPRVESII